MADPEDFQQNNEHGGYPMFVDLPGNAVTRFFARLREHLAWLLGIPKFSRFACDECEDTGWASYADHIGPRTYHVLDHCRKCRKIRKEQTNG